MPYRFCGLLDSCLAAMVSNRRHTGSTLNAVEIPDHTQTLDQAHCKSCHTSRVMLRYLGRNERQVFDIPAITFEVTAHRATFKKCPDCGAENKDIVN